MLNQLVLFLLGLSIFANGILFSSPCLSFQRVGFGAKISMKINGPPNASSLKTKIRELCQGTSNGLRATDQQKILVEDLAEQLCKYNPTKKPAKSGLMKGKWKMIYSNVPGPSSGRIGPFIGNVFQDLQPENKRIYNLLELGPSWALRGALEADLEILDDENWAITFDFVYNKFNGIEIINKKFDKIERRIWNIKYLEKDFRIMYGYIDGEQDKKYIFILNKRDS